ncbi:MAG: baseplate wedge protein [Caudoviricetes sp.]|nr:MAG: baseplate wedge protein [Caudoviricetes sp.]
MSSSVRQSELFAGNDWTAIYKAFTNINLNSFDYNSILQSMVQYIKQNYPEVFNDWTDNDEYLTIIQLVANIAESLAFRMDLNSRENFIDLARRRESVLRLARFLSYNPKRNIAANGLLKITSVKTNDNIYDSNGNDLSNVTINWNDTTNQNWYEQFITVLNASFVNTNPFGTYLDEMEVSNVISQLYRINNNVQGMGVNSFYSTINGTQYPFEIVNTEFNSTKTSYSEVEPDLTTPFQIVYMNDNNGNSSNSTGFFSMFKQGTLNVQTYNLTSPIENRTIDINVKNINNNDLWVQSVDDSGFITSNGRWTRVGYVPTEDTTKIILTSDNITYNGVSNDIRNIYQDITQVDDDVVLRFGDGRFGTTPTGNLRVWYRVSANENMTITSDDIENITIQLNYYNSNNIEKQLTITYNLMSTVSNGSISETTDQIKQRVGSVYSTQGRMVSGSDYNSLPLSNQEVIKIKSINRFYSGQSRYIDLNDPTGMYQNTNIFCDDGAIYIDTENKSTEISTKGTITISEISDDYISDILSNIELSNFLRHYWIENSTTLGFVSTSTYTWKNVTTSPTSSTGNILDSNNNIINIGSGNTDSMLKNLYEGCMIKFTDSNNIVYWTTLINVDSNNNIILNTYIPDNSKIIMILPVFRNTFNNDDYTTIKQNLSLKKSFGIGYDYKLKIFYIIDIDNIDIDNDYSSVNSNIINSNTSWIIYCEYSPTAWRIYNRSINYIFESTDENKFYFVNTSKNTNDVTGVTGQDYISILKYNFNKNYSDIDFNIIGNYYYNSGYIEPRRVYVDFVYNNENPINPEYFTNIINFDSTNTYVFHKLTTDYNNLPYWEIYTDITIVNSIPSTLENDTVYFVTSTNTFITTYSGDLSSNYQYNIGSNNLSFMWKHFAEDDRRIDPSISNIIDIYVLTSNYYNSMLTWRNNGADKNSIPLPPTETELNLLFSDLEEYKMFSDTIVWKPVKFKMIGGETSNNNYQFTLKAIKLNSTTISDGQLKSNIISTVNKYFNINNGWDFGDTFYASELIAYLHIQLAESIASIVLVPVSSDQNFGDLFQINSNSDELFFSTLTVNDVEIISNLTAANLRIN